MKKLLFMCLALSEFGMVYMSYDQSVTDIDDEPGEYLYIKLKNECDQAVKYEYSYSRGATSGSLSANYQRKITLQVDAKLYVNGKLIQEITKEDDKQVIMACQ
ncbi:hypothetical protein N8Z27_00240 [Crocinitomicaceae bacterium]|nr:hypothetical protein [Crocinitomicaceae bacterium]MDA9274995.1 hypothetical protein [Crocinitomicaceae bacterium]MDC1282590.1 hypothetical protein [Crocinitomicaceae bacterium]